MAVKRNTVVQSLSIALIIFVMLTFVLAVTTFVFFGEQTRIAKNAEEELAAEKQRGAENAKAAAERDLLKGIVGLPDKGPDEVKTDRDEIFATRYPDVQEDAKTYKNLVELLQKSIDEKDEALKAGRAELEAEKKRAEAAAAEAAAMQKQLQEMVAAKEVEAQQMKKDFAADRARFTEQEQQLVADQKSALDRATTLDRLVEEIAKGEQFLSPERQTRFKGQAAEERIRTVFDELRECEKTIVRQNDALAGLRAADKSLQETVLAATPKNTREEGFDGRIISVNEADRSVLVSVRSSGGVRPGLLFNVYGPDDPRPELAARKAVIEVVAVETDSVVKARVRRDSVGDPILPGDGVATSFWEAGSPLEVVVIGFVQIDQDIPADPDRLGQMIERIGGRVEQSVGPSTTIVVDAGQPRNLGVPNSRATGWRPADDVRREKQLKEAKRLGVRVVGLDAFLEMMGLERASIDDNRLDRPGTMRAAPARVGNAAF
ncbi:MAG: hypothetical protein EBZ59_08370 [Planctomycetia bacterium]|nr:hypothetical protein [Planctomycetia bacterium]